MRILLLAAAAALVAWLLRRRGRDDGDRVVVAWQDGSELELRPGSPEGERLVAIAQGVVR
ncbi:MAG TPA: hypothetical protein VFN99_00655 [Gaiella sp.]|nr:hypothetical protein [Gaiella sp.]